MEIKWKCHTATKIVTDKKSEGNQFNSPSALLVTESNTERVLFLAQPNFRGNR